MEGSNAPHTATLRVPVAAVIVDGDRQALVDRISARPQQRCARKDLRAAHPEATPGRALFPRIRLVLSRVIARVCLQDPPPITSMRDPSGGNPVEDKWFSGLKTVCILSGSDRIYSLSVTRTRLMTEFTHG